MCAVFVSALFAATPQKPPQDPLGRTNPRSTVTEFLEACHGKNYERASQYLEMSQIPQRQRAVQGIQLAKDLESVLNSDSHFDVLKLSMDPQGNVNDDPDSSVEHVSSITHEGQSFPITLQRVQQSPGVFIWLFSSSTVAILPKIAPVPTPESAIAARLPRFLVTTEILDTPLWKWIVLLLAALVIAALFRFLSRLAVLSVRTRAARPRRLQLGWLNAIVQPLLLFIAAIAFRITEEFVAPSALTRVYIADFLLLVAVSAIAWFGMNVVDIFLRRVDLLLDPRQRQVSHSLIYLGRRTSRVVIAAIAAVFVLDNWGVYMTTIIAGLGVGGIAVALAAQQTIANIFGGVSVIGDHPVMVGDFGNFGGVIGSVDDIGMRSTRIRTLNRTIVSIPNSAFAGMNLENYSLRDKILFNPTLQVKRTVPKEQVQKLITLLGDTLKKDSRLEVGPAPVRIAGLSSASFAIELFAYVLTPDIDEFYKIEADLFLEINDTISQAGVELV